MKKLSIYILMFICLFGICMSSCSSNRIKYPAGIDTIMSFGDGSFQITRGMLHNSLFLKNIKAVSLETWSAFRRLTGKAILQVLQ